jgi:acetolactate synthase-1/3 small subunit
VSEHQLVVAARPGREVPVRITGLLIPLDIEMIAIHFTHPMRSEDWHVELTVRVPSGSHLDFLVKRLDRLIDVLHVCATGLEGGSHESAARTDTAAGDSGTYAYAN